jgi:hypothetical protein
MPSHAFFASGKSCLYKVVYGAFPNSSVCLLNVLACAAELLQDGKMSRAADVYSFAMIMWELFTCKRLYEGHIASQVPAHGCACATLSLRMQGGRRRWRLTSALAIVRMTCLWHKCRH